MPPRVKKFIQSWLINTLAVLVAVYVVRVFTLVINALLLYFVGYLLRPHFYVNDFSSAFWGALIISIVSVILNSLTGAGNPRVRWERRRRPPDDRDGGGPVIDV